MKLKGTAMGKLIKEARLKNKDQGQSSLARVLGYGNGQFISNIERGLCQLPIKLIPRVSAILQIDQNILIDAALTDYKNAILETINPKESEHEFSDFINSHPGNQDSGPSQQKEQSNFNYVRDWSGEHVGAL